MSNISASIFTINSNRQQANNLRERAKSLTKAANDLRKFLLKEKAQKIKEIREEYQNV